MCFSKALLIFRFVLLHYKKIKFLNTQNIFEYLIYNQIKSCSKDSNGPILITVHNISFYRKLSQRFHDFIL